MKRRFRLPSLDALRTFEVAARRLSFTAAAEELFVTQGAVSQRIKALEDEIGEPLFFRHKSGLRLSPKGEQLARKVREAIEHIHSAFDDAAASRPLRVSVLPSFAHLWIMPRLPRFMASNPAVRVEMLAQGEVVDLYRSDIDLAIRFGPGRYDGLMSERLMGDSVIPVCTPELLSRYAEPRTAADLVGMPILRDAPTEHDGSGTDWATWLVRVGWPQVDLGPGQLFSQADFTIDAAARGLGVALARASLIGEHLAAGRLVRLPLPAVPTPYSYHMIWRAETGEATAVLRRWLRSEAEAADNLTPCANEPLP
jgi:LysR family transcriptional regulator, glycine cleavage system transcriptional activator